MTAWVKQDTGVDLTFFLRVAGDVQLPGRRHRQHGTVPSGVWTQVSWSIDPNDSGVPARGRDLRAGARRGRQPPDRHQRACVLVTSQDVAFALAIDKVTITSVPEPGTALLAAFGLLGLGAFSRRRAA